MSSAYQNEGELELGLGLSLHTGSCSKNNDTQWGGEHVKKIKTAKDSVASQGDYSASPPAVSQVVGWPPIRSYRMNNIINQTKSTNGDQEEKEMDVNDTSKDSSKKINQGRDNNDTTTKERGLVKFVKVNMDGLQIGRKIDLSVHACYETLARTIEEMFFKSSTTMNSIGLAGMKKQTVQPSKLLDGSSEFVLTYEDKEGDWMLVGDVPWGMFLNTAKRLRIMKTSEAGSLAPRLQERPDTQKTKPPQHH
ncbi:hypothetical protein ACET3Z_029455 [Daucus carota]